MKQIDLGQLSGREIEIVELAVSGMTDQQIGQRLGITASTVNSYWVRIRGKLGHLSRTELVSRLLQQRSSHDIAQLLARIAELEQELEQAKGLAKDAENAELLRAMIEANPEAVLTIHESGTITVASANAGKLFCYRRHELEGMNVNSILRYGYWARDGDFMDIIRKDQSSGKLPTRQLFARTSEGEMIRVVLNVGSATTPKGIAYVCVVRPFAAEIDSYRMRAASVVAEPR